MIREICWYLFLIITTLCLYLLVILKLKSNSFLRVFKKFKVICIQIQIISKIVNFH